MKYEVDIIEVNNGEYSKSFYGIYSDQEKACSVASELASLGMDAHVEEVKAVRK